jgi:uncharacterized protein
MAQKNPIGWVEIPVIDLDRAEKFYTDFFGISCTRQPEAEGFVMSMFPMDEGYGASGALVRGEGLVPSKEGALVYFTAPEGGITAAVEKAKSLDITILMNYMDIGEFGHMAIIEDSEGNRIALHSENK